MEKGAGVPIFNFMGAVAPMETTKAQQMEKGTGVPRAINEVEERAGVPSNIMEVARAVVPTDVDKGPSCP